MNAKMIKLVLALLGLFVLYSGVDTALGGFSTLGLMDATPYFDIVNPAKFQVMDNHQRFLGGVWTGIGVLLFVAVFDLARYRTALSFAFGMVFLGGLARFSQMNFEALADTGVYGAAIIEIVGMPLLYLWLSKTLRNTESTGASQALLA